jgi:hypothetical protein
VRRALLLGLVAASPLTLWIGAGTAHAASQTPSVVASINGQQVAHSTASHPLRLVPAHPATVVLRVTNPTSRTLDVRTVQLQGQVLGLTFFAFNTSVGLDVAPDSSGTLRYNLDLSGLNGQATGLIPTTLSLLDAQGNVITSERVVGDVRGSLISVYGLFGLGLLVLTVIALVSALLALSRHRLPANRFRRGARFLVPGVGLGLVFAFTLSALRVWVPTNGLWLVVILVTGALFFVLGYLTPSGEEETEEEPEEEPEEETVEPAVLADAQSSGKPTVRT